MRGGRAEQIEPRRQTKKTSRSQASFFTSDARSLKGRKEENEALLLSHTHDSRPVNGWMDRLRRRLTPPSGTPGKSRNWERFPYERPAIKNEVNL